MDSITQGLLGAAAAQAFLSRRLGKRAWIYGAVGGMAPDLDILIRSASDPLVAFRFHRHFTHSLAFIPVGGILSALPWVLRKRFAAQRREVVLATTAGYATHALLDACTSYGTMLWWPFSHARVAWSSVAIVDPIYSGILLLGVILGVRMATRRVATRPARLALLLSTLYLALGFVQHGRAVQATRALAQQRGHSIDRIDAFPAPPVDFLWRTLYASEGRVYVSQVRVPWGSAAVVTPGSSVDLATEEDMPPAVREDPRAREGFEVFQWFANGWVAWQPEHPDVLGDLRYAVEDTSVSSMWGVRLQPGQPVTAYRAEMSKSLGKRWHALWGDEQEK
jgi:inner membrane protein